LWLINQLQRQSFTRGNNMKRGFCLAAVLFLAGPAEAQVTKCGWEFGKWVCRTTGAPGTQSGANGDWLSNVQAGAAFANEMSDRIRQGQARAAEEARQAQAAEAESRVNRQSEAADAELRALEIRKARAEAEEAEERAKLARLDRERQESVEAVRRLIDAGNCAEAAALARLNFGERGERDAKELCPT
jgi:hypothetical protein